MTSYAPGDFSFLDSKAEQGFLSDAYQAITEAGLWSWFMTESPPENKGYMLWDAPQVKQIEAHMKKLGSHSGASYGWTLRTMQTIARDGWDAYVAAVILRQNEQRHTELVRRVREEVLRSTIRAAATP